MDFVADFKRRVAENSRGRWIRFTLVSLVFFAWVVWLQNWWVALWWLLLFDIYITGYIPLTWWKKSKSATTRTVMGWVDAIVYALVLVYFVFAFVGQNYQIPSSSLEKTLLTGDYLWVNKMAYGPRVPQTPIHFPLVQNTLPVVNTRSYLEKPQFAYHRLAGYDTIKLGDIVVFNFPAGDSTALKMPNPDLYQASRMIGQQLVGAGRVPQPAAADAIAAEEYYRTVGKEYMLANPAEYGEIIRRPVDRRENYVKRTVGLPGQKFQIIDGIIYNDGVAMPTPAEAQFSYVMTHRRWNQMTRAQREQFWDDLGVSQADRKPDYGESRVFPPLTAEMVETLRANPDITTLRRREFRPYETPLFPYVVAMDSAWTLDDYGPLTIPARGMTVRLDAEGWATYGHAIAHYEPVGSAVWRNGRAYIDGKPAEEYTFTMDYYFMMGDNRHKSSDSRFWGFVPEDHIVGRPERVLISFDPDKSFPSNIRWNRIFKKASN